MTYDYAVHFSVTDTYGCGPENEDDVYTRKGFSDLVARGMFNDDDGHGHPVKDGVADGSISIKPSSWPKCMPDDATHVVWYNK